MTDINKDLIEAVNKHIPNLLATQLRERLEKGERAIEMGTTLLEENDALRKRIADEAELERAREGLTVREDTLKKREREVDARAFNFELELMKVRLEEANKRGEFAEKLALGLVRNTEYRRNTFGNVPFKDGSGYITSAGTNETVDETAT